MEEVNMKRIWLVITLVPLLVFGANGGAGAASLDQLKEMLIDKSAVLRTKPATVPFTFANFRLQSDPQGPATAWWVDLTVRQDIQRGYLVRSVFQGRNGEALFSGEDIELPASRVGDIRHLTRPLPKDSRAKVIVLQVVNQQENRIVTSQHYPLSDVASYGIQGATVSRTPAVPHGVLHRNAAPIGDIEYALTFLNTAEEENGKIQIQNKSAYLLRLDSMKARATFQVGIDREFPVRCDANEIQPGQGVACNYTNDAALCATLQGIEFTFKLNGNSCRETLKLDAPLIRSIFSEPVIRLEKRGPTSSRYDMCGSGIAHVTVRGSYIKPGARVTMKAVASVDSDKFPVVFTGTQEDDGIHASVEVIGEREGETPEKFCFRLLEITTDDMCGGVGVLLYRNHFRGYDFDYYPPSGSGYYFLNNRHCK
jgi:hypothetical protein